MRSRLIRLLVIVLITFAYTYYKVTLLAPEHSYLAGIVTPAIYFLILGALLIPRLIPTTQDSLSLRLLSWVGYLTMGLWATYVLFSLPMDLLQIWVSFGISRQNVSFIVLLITLATCLLGLLTALQGPKLISIEIPIPKLPHALQGLKIVQLSDLHIGATIRQKYLKRVVQIANQTDPDLVVITGDLADAKTKFIESELQILNGLKSRLGIFFVTGNHEYYSDAFNLVKRLKQLGWETLINENRLLDWKGSKIFVAGVTDPMGESFSEEHTPDIAKAATGIENADLRLLLAHQPQEYVGAESHGFNLQFSGHTHSGQFFPFNLFMPMAHKYYRGLHQIGKLWLYVSRGTGYWGPANRFAIRAEVTLATIK